MINPPIDKLIKLAPCRYALVVALTKRTKELLSMDTSELETSNKKAVQLAAEQIYNGDIKITV
jgi:DNA-directed RNA polymerase omega subunit